MLNVLLTVDTEIWPRHAGWPDQPLPKNQADFSRELAHDIDGHTSVGDFGLPFQLALLRRHGLKATYFIEALCAGRTGLPVLKGIVRQVLEGRQDVQLHLHTEWLSELDDAQLPTRHRQYMAQFSREQQAALIRKGLANLSAAGAPPVVAFRAGSFGANRDTLRALADNGIGIDSSYNRAYPCGDWGLSGALAHPARFGQVWEFPIAAFCDYPGHFRPAQLNACSVGEMRHALIAAASARWPVFVIVLHGFELLSHRHGSGLPTPDRLNISRFRQLCSFLDTHRTDFRTAWFHEVDLDRLRAPAASFIRSRPLDTATRVLQQAMSRFT